MTDIEFAETIGTVNLIGRLLAGLGDQLDVAVDKVSTGEAIGPVQDPTGFVTGVGQRLKEQHQVLRAAIGLRDACRQLTPTAST